jgi:GR25 family glycosyltransferase involved in LPS biosynthesis
MRINEFFHKAYCINLERAKERREACVQEFKKHSLDVSFWEATEGRQVKKSSYNPFLNNGEIGVYHSQLKLVRHAKKNNFENILIFEDDVAFVDDLQEQFASIVEQIPKDWDFIFFGCQNWFNNHEVFGVYPEPEKISDKIYRIYAGYCLHAYAINKKAYKIMDGLWSRTNEGKPIDLLMSEEIYPNCNTYMIRPPLAWQRKGYSYIRECWQNYEHKLTR